MQAVRGFSRAQLRAGYVLLLLAGLLGMHGLATHQNHDATVAGVSTAPHGQVHSPADVVHTLSAAMAVPHLAVDALGSPTSCEGGCDRSPVTVCVALLTAAVLLLLASRRVSDVGPARARPRRVRVRTAPVRGPPDLVSVLCVSRT